MYIYYIGFYLSVDMFNIIKNRHLPKKWTMSVLTLYHTVKCSHIGSICGNKHIVKKDNFLDFIFLYKFRKIDSKLSGVNNINIFVVIA